MRWLDGIADSRGYKFEQTLGDSEGQEKPGVLQSVGVTKNQTLLCN